ncbi:MAG: GTPase Era [Gemmatimonadetes bacterium]|nr:GTPase Era [Gemmatimonadota bacterium]
MTESKPESKPEHRAGYVALVGRPNVGKSTLMNALLDTRLAITSKRPQTTRTRVTGILNGEGYQAVLVDTPGVVRPSDPLRKEMMRTAESVVRDADAVVYLVEAVGRGSAVSPIAIGWLRESARPALLVLNKIDRLPRLQLLPMIDRLRDANDWTEIVPISALKRDGIDRVIGAIERVLPEGPPLFLEGELSEEPERFFAAEFVREQLMRQLEQELPYAVAVEVERFERAEEGGRRLISALIVVERESQKGIVVGKGGQMIKKIGTAARRSIESFLGEPLTLDLLVKVEKNWSTDPRRLARFGYRGRG